MKNPNEPTLIFRVNHPDLSPARRIAVAALGESILPDLLASPEPDLTELLAAVKTAVNVELDLHDFETVAPGFEELQGHERPNVHDVKSNSSVMFDINDPALTVRAILRAAGL